MMELEPREGTLERIVSLLRSLRALAMQYPGFDGGMVWFCEAHSNHLLVISHWRAPGTWESFKKATGTTEVLSNMAILLAHPLRELHFASANDSDQFPSRV